jgi:DNA-binding IclR family transcriptional regulator
MQFAETVLRGSTATGVRHAVLRQLVVDVGETCNLTALSGAEVIYLDRVETAFPLRLELGPGSRVPLHCSASGKLFLAHLPRAQRERLLDGIRHERHTPHTVLAEALEAEIERISTTAIPWMPRSSSMPGVCRSASSRRAARPVRCAVALEAPRAHAFGSATATRQTAHRRTGIAWGC